MLLTCFLPKQPVNRYDVASYMHSVLVSSAM